MGSVVSSCCAKETYAKDDACDPVDVGATGGGKACEADDTCDTASDGTGELVLRGGLALRCLRLDALVGLPVRDSHLNDDHRDGAENANSDAKERKSLQTRVPSAALLEHNGVGGKVEVQGAVNDSDVDAHHENDRVEQEQPRE